jgi:hypothetical protein
MICIYRAGQTPVTQSINWTENRPVGHVKLNETATERLTFELLTPLIDWHVVPGSIVQPNPPQPDMLCGIDGRGLRTVELMTLDHPWQHR